MIIDVHTHIFEPLVKAERGIFMKDRHFALLYANEKSKIIVYQELVEAMDQSHIDYAVAMGFPWIETEFCLRQNEYFSEVVSRTQGKIQAFGSIPLAIAEQCNNGKDAVMLWTQKIKDAGLVGIGEIGFYTEGMTDKYVIFLEHIFQAAWKYSMPVCLHINEPVGHTYTGKYDPCFNVLYQLLVRYPGLKVVLAHWGGGLLFYELMPEVKQVLSNCYYDTAASPFLYNDDIYEHALSLVGSEKILFASDYPLISFKRYLEPIGKNITGENDRNNMLGKNAAQLFGIK